MEDKQQKCKSWYIVPYAKMNVNCSVSQLRIINANFLIVCYPTHFKTLSYIYFRNKNSNPNNINYKNLRKSVSGLYSLCWLTCYCVFHLEIA